MTMFDDLGGSRSAHSPYVGPRPFRRTDADRFFGRSLEARDVKHLWIGNQLTVLHGRPAWARHHCSRPGYCLC